MEKIITNFASFIGILLASYTVGYIQLSVMQSSSVSQTRAILVYFGLAVMCYAATYQITLRLKKLQSWQIYLLTGTVGSAVYYLFVHASDELSHAWRFRESKDISLFQFSLETLQNILPFFVISTIFFAFIVLALMSIVHLASKMVINLLTKSSKKRRGWLFSL